MDIKENKIANFDFSADAKKIKGSDNLEFGIIARYNSQNQPSIVDNYYYLLIKAMETLRWENYHQVTSGNINLAGSILPQSNKVTI
jgi:hypothetical protein